MKIEETPISGLYIIAPQLFKDERGYFFESFNQKVFEQHIGPIQFVQDNESQSSYGVVRGLHFQKPPYTQAKLLRVVQGRVLDVAVDLRKDSPTYGKSFTVELSSDNHRQVFLPKGMAHGFSVLSEKAIFQYKCDAFYHPASEAGIAWNDPSLNIDWQIPSQDIILSEKDKKHQTLREKPYYL